MNSSDALRGPIPLLNTVTGSSPGFETIAKRSPPTPQAAGMTTAAVQAPAYVDQYGRVVPAGFAPQAPAYVPAVYTPAVAPAPAPRASAPVRRSTTARVEPKRSWKKTALVIGGSAGAGAGVGAIVGGKKGALIGAAIGGGGASIYEAIKRN